MQLAVPRKPLPIVTDNCISFFGFCIVFCIDYEYSVFADNQMVNVEYTFIVSELDIMNDFIAKRK